MQGLRSVVLLALASFLVHASDGRRLISTVIHRDAQLIANQPTKLDIEVVDSFGDVVPWGDLLLVHQRKVHVYAIHQELDYVQHLHPDDFGNFTDITTTLPLSVTFPVEGTWTFHFNFAVRSQGKPHGDSISTLGTVDVTCSKKCSDGGSSRSKEQKAAVLEYPMASTPVADMHTAKGMVAMPPEQGDIKVTPNFPDGGLWKGDCHRVVFRFTDAASGQPLTHMQPFLGAAMHALIAKEPKDLEGRFHESDMMHTHGYPSRLDHDVGAWNEKEPADICSMQIHNMQANKTQIGPEIVMYARFPNAGKHHIFVQVSVDGNVHVADITVHVEDVLIKVDTSDGPDGNTQLDLSFALDSEALPDARARSNDTLSAVPEHPPCFSVVGAQLNWFGSMCLSACQGSEDPAFKCAVPLLSTDELSKTVHVITAAELSETSSKSSSSGSPGSEAVRVVELPKGPAAARPFVSARFDDSNSKKDPGVRVQLKVNSGMTVFAGSCVFLELHYERQLDDGTFMDLDELQQVARAAARILVSGPGLEEPRLLFAHSMLPSFLRPWDNLDATLTAPEGMMLWSLAEPCMPAFERFESPRVSGNLGSRLGMYVQFPEPGDYTVLSQAEFEGKAVFSRHNVYACAWSASGAWSDPCMWDQEPESHSHVTIERGMHMMLDVTPPPLSSLTVHGVLEVSSSLQDVDWHLGRLSIGESGTVVVGNRSSLHPGNFQLTLNSSLLPQLPYHDAVSTLDVHGTLKMWSADLEMEDGPVRSWKAGQFSEDAFILEMDEDPVEFSSGTLLGLVSSHGEEVASVKDFEKSSGKVKLQKKLQTNHGKNAIVYKLSRSMKIKAAGSAVLRVWNGLHHAGGGVDPLAPPNEHGHRRRLQNDLRTSRSAFSAADSSWQSTWGRSRTLLGDTASDALEKVSDSGYSDTYIYRTSIHPDDTGADLELHGVEIDGLGLEHASSSKAALEVVDHACAVRWPDYRKYVSLLSCTMHSLPAGCVLFDGCTGGFEVRPHSTLIASKAWRIGMEHVVVHVSSSAQPVPANRHHSLVRSPAALMIGNAEMPVGSLTHHLTLSISDGVFVNPVGAAVVWSPAVPGSITDSTVRGSRAEAEADFPSCIPSGTAGDWNQAPVNITLLEHASVPVLHESGSSAGSLSRSVTAFAANSDAASGPPVTSEGSEARPMAQLHLHIPSEAYFMTTMIQEVQGAQGVQALLTWPSDVSVWGEGGYDSLLFTGGLPCSKGGCTQPHSSSNRPSDAWIWNEKVDGSLAPSTEKPAAFSIAPLGPGIYGMNLLPDRASAGKHMPAPFRITVSSEILKCTPGFVPISAKTCDAGAAGVVQWDYSAGGTLNGCATCERPVKLSLNQATKGIVMEGNGGTAYFQFSLPPGVASVFLVVRVLASDDPDNSIDFYATRNTPWTKDSPERVDLESSYILPILTKDADSSIKAQGYEISPPVMSPPWGEYFGVVSQSVATATAATEVEVTVVTGQHPLEALQQGSAEWDPLQQHVTYVPQRRQLRNGENKLQLKRGDKEVQFFVKVPVGVQELHVAADSKVKRIAASHGNWQSPESLQKYELESEDSNLDVSPSELYGRWGTWFISVNVGDDVKKDAELVVKVTMDGSTCAGTPQCSGHGTCLQRELYSWCRCDAGWFGYMCEVPAPNIHSGVHQDLPQQLLFSLDSVMAEEGSKEGIHIEDRAPLGVAAADLHDMQGAAEAMFGHGLCRGLLVGASDGAYDDDTRDEPPAQPAEEPAKPADADAADADAADSDAADADAADADAATDQSHTSEADAQQPAGPAVQPADAEADKTAGDSTTGAPPPSSAHDVDPSNASKQPSPGDRAGDSSTAPSGSASAEPPEWSGKGGKGKEPDSTPEYAPENWDVELLLPGAGVELQYQAAVEEFVRTQMPAQQPSSVAQSSVLVTAYSVHAHAESDSSNGHPQEDAPAAVMTALQVALSQHLQRHKSSQATVSVVLSNEADAQSANSTSTGTPEKRLLMAYEELQHMHLEAGVVIQGLDWASHEPLEEMLEQQDSVSAVQNGMNEELKGSGVSIKELVPAVVSPGILLSVECAATDAAELSQSTACGHDAATWVLWVHQAAAVKELQEPEDVWVLKNDRRTEAVVLAGDFGSLHVEEPRWNLPVGTFVLAAAATAAAAIFAVAIYATFSRYSSTRGMWQGYQSVRATAAVPVGESVPSSWSPRVLRQPWQSSLCKRPKGARAWQEPVVSATAPPKESCAALPQSQPSWLRQNSQRTLRASSLQSLSLDPLRLESLRASPLEPVLPPNGQLGTEIQCSPRTTASDIGSVPHNTPETVRMRPAASSFFFGASGGKDEKEASPDVAPKLAPPELHESCMPATEHLPAFKPWMKGSKKEGVDRKLSWIPSFSSTFSLSSQASSGPDSLAACVDATLARLQSAASPSTLVSMGQSGSDQDPRPGLGTLSAIQEDGSFAFPSQSRAARSSKDSGAPSSGNNQISQGAVTLAAWVESGEVQASPLGHGAEHAANDPGGADALQPTSQVGHRDSTADTQPRNWYLGPGPGLFASEGGGSVTGADSTFLSQPSGSFAGAVGGLMLQQVVCTSTDGETHNLHSVPDDYGTAHADGSPHASQT